MSMTVMAYATKVDRIRSFIGSERDGKAKFPMQPPAGAHRDVAAAYAELVKGRPAKRAPRDYVDALELMCRQYGAPLPNDGLATIDTGHYDAVNAALKEYQLGFDLDTVVYSGAILGHPELDKSKSFGVVDAATLATARERLAKRPLSSTHKDVERALSVIEKWVKITAKTSNKDIIGFFY
jgi:hypothetical protein